VSHPSVTYLLEAATEHLTVLRGSRKQ